MRGRQHTRRAEAALQSVMLAKRGLQRGQRRLAREPLNRGDVAALDLDREHQTGPDSGAIDDDSACSAHAVLAAEMGSGLPQHLAQTIGDGAAVRACLMLTVQVEGS